MPYLRGSVGRRAPFANGWLSLTLLGVPKRLSLADTEHMRLCTSRVDHSSARYRALNDESGIALIMAIGIMLVLTIALTSVIFLTASSARDAQRTNADQKAYAVAEAGVSNALAVLNANYPGSTVYPGNPNLLPARTSTYTPGSTVTWSGSLVLAPATAAWTWEWQITSLGSVSNPTGPGTPTVKRRVKAVVPVVLPDSSSVDPSTAAIDFVYAQNDITFGQSMIVQSPIYAGRDLNLENTATISETIPASVITPAKKNRVAVGRNLWQKSPNNQIGHIGGSVDPANQLAEVHVVNGCDRGNTPVFTPPCTFAPAQKIYSVVANNVIPPGYIVLPTLTCCGSGDLSNPVNWAPPADGVAHSAGASASYMGFWYLNAQLGPKRGCASGSTPKFDTTSGTPDGSINQSAYSIASPFDLTGASYTCKSPSGLGELSWNGTTLTIRGTVFIDGSARSSSNNAKYSGKGTIILSGVFTMDNGNSLCAYLVSSNCDTTAAWNPDVNALAIVADGDTGVGNGIEIKKGHFQGLLLANKNVYCQPATGTLVQGPMVSVYGDVSCGQSGVLQFPPISFASTGTDGLVGPLPLPRLLSPRQFNGG